MKKLFVLLTALFTLAQVNAQEKNVIRIATDNTDLILQVAPIDDVFFRISDVMQRDFHRVLIVF